MDERSWSRPTVRELEEWQRIIARSRRMNSGLDQPVTPTVADDWLAMAAVMLMSAVLMILSGVIA